MPPFTDWKPLRKQLGDLRKHVNRLLEDGLAAVSGPELAIDMYETEDAVIVKTSPPANVKAEDIEVSITGSILTIHGTVQDEPAEDVVNYLRKERKSGTFDRSVAIPVPVKAEEAAATFKNGILTVTIPKTEDARPKVVNVKTTNG